MALLGLRALEAFGNSFIIKTLILVINFIFKPKATSKILVFIILVLSHFSQIYIFPSSRYTFSSYHFVSSHESESLLIDLL